MWKKYLPNAKVSYLEYDAPCATKHKADIEAQAGGTLYIGECMHCCYEILTTPSNAIKRLYMA